MLKRMNTSQSLLIVLGFFFTLQLIYSYSFLNYAYNQNEESTSYDLESERSENLDNAWNNLLKSRFNINVASKHIMYSNSPENAPENLKEAQGYIDSARLQWEMFKSKESILGDYSQLQIAFDNYYKAQVDLIMFLEKNMLDGFREQPTQEIQDDFEKQYKAYKSLYSDYTKRSSSDVDREYKKIISITCIILIISLFIIALIWFGIRRILISPLNSIVTSIQYIAKGDLARTIDVMGNNDTRKLGEALRHMQAELAKTVGNVRDSANAIYNGTSEISAGNNDLSSRTEQQAASLEETAASMEELTATVRQNADNARQASHLALTASETAERGGQVVDDVVDTMRDIGDSSRKIADIISVIDSIAFQTNILALNAAVEAARAGEQGRGFAVVAGEVRNLAQRSAQAAREIKALIEDSVGKVDAGSVLVERAGETMNEIVSAVTRVTDIMGEIASASDEQSRGIEQVGVAVTEMDRVTQQNAALVEQSAAAAASLEEQASRLTHAVAVFHIRAGELNTGDQISKMVSVQRSTPKKLTENSNDNWEKF